MNNYVNDLKNYSIGDSIYVKDIVSYLEYNADDDTTLMYFGSTEDSMCLWPFAGDLRERFNIGDDITFKFKVVEEYSTNKYTFESLDYYLESYALMDEGTAADINNYLVE